MEALFICSVLRPLFLIFVSNFAKRHPRTISISALWNVQVVVVAAA